MSHFPTAPGAPKRVHGERKKLSPTAVAALRKADVKLAKNLEKIEQEEQARRAALREEQARRAAFLEAKARADAAAEIAAAERAAACATRNASALTQLAADLRNNNAADRHNAAKRRWVETHGDDEDESSGESSGDESPDEESDEPSYMPDIDDTDMIFPPMHDWRIPRSPLSSAPATPHTPSPYGDGVYGAPMTPYAALFPPSSPFTPACITPASPPRVAPYSPRAVATPQRRFRSVLRVSIDGDLICEVPLPRKKVCPDAPARPRLQHMHPLVTPARPPF